MKMNALVLENINQLEYKELEVPELTLGTVLVKIMRCGICSSDIERVLINGTYHFPTIPGHEFSGQIVKVFSNEDDDLIGKKVSVFPMLPCFECEACKKQRYAQCSNYNYFGSRCDGGYAEYLVVPKWNLVFFDESISYDIAAMSEPTSVAYHAFRQFEIEKNADVVIVGTGTIAYLLGIVCKEAGCNVTIGGRNPLKLETARLFGFDVIDISHKEYLSNYKKTNGKLADYVFELVGSNQAIGIAIELLNDFGKCVVVGNPKDNVALDKNVYWKILRKELTIKGTWNSSYSLDVNDWKNAVKLFKESKFDFSKLISKVYKLSDGLKAFDYLTDTKNNVIKVMYDCTGGEVNE